MAAQFDLYRMQGGGLVVVLQNDLLDQLRTRVVAPLVPASSIERVMHSLNPTVTLGEEAYLVLPQLAATLTLAEMGERVGSLSMMHDAIVRAVDALLSGI
jgi:toxin CcdB